MNHQEFEVQALSHREIEHLIRLTDEVEWYFPRPYWQVLLAAGRAFGVYGPEGDLAATATLFDYGPSLAFLGVVIVREKYRGNGLASRVIDAAEQSLGRPSTPTLLVATEDGKPVYESRGYRVLGTCSKFLRPKNIPWAVADLPGYHRVSIEQASWQDVLRFDREATSVDRGSVLSAMIDAGCTGTVLFESGAGRVAGFALASMRHDLRVVGPVVAGSREQALALCKYVTEGCTDPLRIDVYSHQPNFQQDLLRQGFELDEESPLMLLPGSGDEYTLPERAFAITSQALG